jgi:hypothetical protein
MASAQRYTESIRRLDYHGLRALWSAIAKDDTPGWERGKAFEDLVVRAFELDHCRVRYPYRGRWPGDDSEIEQVGGTVYADGLSCLIESKDAEAQNIAPIAKMRNQLLRRPASVIGAIFSRAGFTPSARLLATFAVPQTVLLWDGGDVAGCLEKESFRELLLEKYQKAVEEGLPDYDAPRRRHAEPGPRP